MTDTSTPADFAQTLGTMAATALVQGASARQALLTAREALDAGDMDQVSRIIRNATAPTYGSSPDSIQDAVRVSLPSSGEQTSY